MIFIFCILIIVSAAEEITVSIDSNSSNSTNFYHFWKSTGFCPPDPKEDISKYLLSDEQKLNIALIGALPNNGITHVRIHWLLNLLTELKTDSTTYNFTSMDIFLSLLNQHSLLPGFEFMGSSNGLIKFEKGPDFWKKLVENTVNRYIDKFGIQQVAKWRFETWNEPDLRGYNVLNFTLTDYLRYVTGCSAGLKEAFGTNTDWKLGGPAGLFRDKSRHPLCWGLLEACGSPGIFPCPLKFLSFHRKGGGSTSGLLNGTFQLLDLIYGQFPGLSKMAVANDEADIEENWSRSLEWRGDARYAAMVVRAAALYYKSLAEGGKLKIEVMSNDNGFLNYHPFYFTQRTLFARFQMNNTTPRYYQFIKKPVYSVMSLLSLLGDEYLEVESSTTDPLLTVVATRHKRGKDPSISVILVYGNETKCEEGISRLIHVVFRNLHGANRKFLIYQLDNVETNPYEVWKGLGGPFFPDRYQRRKMRDVEEPKRVIDPTVVTDATLNVSLKLTIPCIYYINICTKSKKSPGAVYSVTVFNVTYSEVLITWKFKLHFSNCLRTFEVENQSECSTSPPHFKRINSRDTIFRSFHHVGKADRACEWTRGLYRVRAVDYWDRAGYMNGKTTKYTRTIT